MNERKGMRKIEKMKPKCALKWLDVKPNANKECYKRS